MAPRKKSPMSDEHKAALAEGRAQGRAVRNYLEALEASKVEPGRKRTPESIKKRIAAIDASLADADPVHRLQLAQERLDLQASLASLDNTIDVAQLEVDFVAAAGPYGQRKGISYKAWRAVGVPAAVLKQAGISRKH